MKHLVLIAILCIFSFKGISQQLIKPSIVVAQIEQEYTVENIDSSHSIYIDNKKLKEVIWTNNSAVFKLKLLAKQTAIRVESKDYVWEENINPIPLFLSVFPPLLAILIALLTREVISSLFIGVFVGAATIGIYQKGLWGLFSGLLMVFDTYILDSLNNSDHLSVILFSLTIGGVVALISKNGGMQGVVNRISVYANSPKNGQLATYFLGLAIFFDDYANTLVVGNTMRGISDKLKISREKLAYIVDSTAAPVASLAFVTTWIGAELGYIGDGVSQIPQLNEGAYAVFINSLAYSFYPIYTLAFILILILSQRDFGTMLVAEKQARLGMGSASKTKENSDFLADENTPQKAFNALIPILILIFGTIISLVYTGYSEETWSNPNSSFFFKLSQTIGEADAYKALLWSSLLSLLSAIFLTVSQRILTLSNSIEAIIKGFKEMMTAMLILVLAWSLAQITHDLHTADFLKSLWSDALSPVLLPAIAFVLGALVAFSTGSSWGTMAILYPLLLPTSFSICLENGYTLEETLPIFYNVVSCVLAGSVLGDHCSPISDTTILSSLASGCNHIAHVKTQMPYALTVGLAALLVGTLPAALGITSWLLYPLGIVVLALVVLRFGRKIDGVVKTN